VTLLITNVDIYSEIFKEYYNRVIDFIGNFQWSKSVITNYLLTSVLVNYVLL
jgi:hypothetical protein